jgi:peptidoglycan/LPS O-acetylase OafA/YrhL
MLGHIQPPLENLSSGAQLFITLGLSDGGWAVMVFFVISGLCIHLPYIMGKPFHAKNFLLARFCRIGIPLICAYFLSLALVVNLDKILWSLYCEIAYYLAYPLLRYLFSQYGIKRVLFVSLSAAILTSLLPDDNAGNFFFFEGVASPMGTIILGLPIWLLGCMLAESMISQKELRFKDVIALRFWVLFMGLALPILSFMDEVISGFPSIFLLNTKYSFLLSSPLIYCWLLAEITQKDTPKIYSYLKPFGAGAYSIYLMHIFGAPIFQSLPVFYDPFFNWVVIVSIVLLISTIFYFSIEKPSHRLGRRLSKKFLYFAP